MLLDVLNEDYVEVKYPAKDYEDAVRKCGELLVKNGAATEDYIEAMLENVKVNGTYIVIAPGIAMPHARPEKGAVKTGFSIMTLESPINFGHPTNDPVSLVIGLCATDHETHLKALSELVEFLSNEENIRLLHEADSKEVLMKTIRGGISND